MLWSDPRLKKKNCFTCKINSKLFLAALAAYLFNVSGWGNFCINKNFNPKVNLICSREKKDLRSHWGFISNAYTLYLLCKLTAAFTECAAHLGWRLRHGVNFIICSSTLHTRQRFPAVEVYVLIEGRSRRAGPPPLFVPHNIILFSNSMWLVGYSEVHQRLSSSLLHWNLAKLPKKQPQIEKHRVLCVSGQWQFSRTIPEPQLPQTKHTLSLIGWCGEAGCPPGPCNPA